MDKNYLKHVNVDSFFLYRSEQGITTKLTLDGEFPRVVGVSPDRKAFLYSYVYHDYDQYVLMDASGRTLTQFDDFFDGGHISSASWLQEGMLRLLKMKYEDDNNDTIIVFAYDIAAQQITVLNKTYPEGYQYLLPNAPGKYRDSWNNEPMYNNEFKGANLVYSPDQTRVFYPKDGEMVALTDMESGKLLAEEVVPAWGRLPRWSWNSQSLAIIVSENGQSGQDELYLLSRDGGKLQRLTFLTTLFPTVHILEYTWSPDGNQIAFWLNTETQDPTANGLASQLVTLDIRNGTITDTCLAGVSVPYLGKEEYSPGVVQNAIYQIKPVWSPDGQRLAITQNKSTDFSSLDVVIVDLNLRKSMVIGHNMQPLGWMLPVP